MATFGEEEYEAHVVDIEGCFPSMPKDKIRFAMMQLVQEARQEGHKGKPCRGRTQWPGPLAQVRDHSPTWVDHPAQAA